MKFKPEDFIGDFPFDNQLAFLGRHEIADRANTILQKWLDEAVVVYSERDALFKENEALKVKLGVAVGALKNECWCGVAQCDPCQALQTIQGELK